MPHLWQASPMQPTLCMVGGCNGAGKTTLARELLPMLGIRRFLNVDEIARGLSPLDASLSAFRAGRILHEESRHLMRTQSSFAIESTLSGNTHIALLQQAKERGYRIMIHYLVIRSAMQAVERVALRVALGGHHVPDADVHRRFERSRRQALTRYLPLADEWTVWDNEFPPPVPIAHQSTSTLRDLTAMLNRKGFLEEPPVEVSAMTELMLEAGRRATARMLDLYQRHGIEVTPQMTLARAAEATPQEPRDLRPLTPALG